MTNTPGMFPFTGDLAPSAPVPPAAPGGDAPSEVVVAGEMVLLDSNDLRNCAPGLGGGTGL
jgi:hypothetical protein